MLTTEFLPPGRPLLAALMRSLPTGLVLIIGSTIPPRRWMARFFVLSVLYASGLFPLLFIAAYRLPGGVAAVINSVSPLIVVVISVPLLGSRIRPIQIIAGIVGVLGVALLVLRSDARLDIARPGSHGRCRDHVQRGDRADQAVGPPRGNDLDWLHRLDLPARQGSPCCLPRCSSKDFPTTSRRVTSAG